MKSTNLFSRVLFTLVLIALTCCPAMGAVSTYQYDDLYRLSRVERSDGTVITYNYDEAGNRTRKIVTGTTTTVLNAPTLNAPANNALNQPTSISLSWNDTNSSPQEQGYTVRIRPSGGSCTEHSGAQNSTSLLLSLQPSTTYFWSVKATGDGTTTLDSLWSEERYFTTVIPDTCTFALNPTAPPPFSAAGGMGSIQVTASEGTCPWTALSNDPWIVITSGDNGTGNGTVSYLVAAHFGTGSRTGTLAIAGQMVTVSQGVPAPGQWTTPERLTTVPSENMPYTTKDNHSPVVATDTQGNVHMVYKYVQDDLSGLVNNSGPRVIRQDILYKKKTGSTWSNAETVFSLITELNDGGSLTGYRHLSDFRLVVDGNSIPHLAFMFSGAYTDYPDCSGLNQDEVYYTYKNGSSWVAPFNVSDNSTRTLLPDIACDTNNNIHFVWIDGTVRSSTDCSMSGTPAVYHRVKYSDASWSVASTTGGAGYASYPSISNGPDGTIHLVYSDEAASTPGLIYASWNGTQWSSPFTIEAVQPNSYVYHKGIAVQDNSIHVVYDVWEENVHKLKYLSYDGTSWGTPELINEDGTGYMKQPSVAMSADGNPQVTWYAGSDTGGQILYRQKTSAAWSAIVQLNAAGTEALEEATYNVDSAIFSDILYVVWTSLYNGHREVFFNYADVSSTVDTFTIATSAGPNGTITSSQTVNYGADSPAIVVTPNTGYHIQSVLVDGVSQTIPDPTTFSITFTSVTANHTVSAIFSPDQFTLTAQMAGNGIGGISGQGLVCNETTCSGLYDYGSVVTITATPDSASTFTGWTGCDSVNGNDCTVNMTADRSVAAYFTLNNYTLTATKTGTGSGTLAAPGLLCIGADCSGSYSSGAVVTMTASADIGSAFTGWTGCDSVDGNVCTVNMATNRSVTANFTLDIYPTYTLTATKTGNGSGTLVASGLSCTGVDCSGSYSLGTVITITASPDIGSIFTGWTSCDSVNGNVCTVNMTADKSISAAFTLSAFGGTASLVLYDDFSGTHVDKNKWKQGDWVREIRDGKLLLNQASPSPAGITSYPFGEFNYFFFTDPNSVNSIQADVSILENICGNPARATGPFSGPRLAGRWYRVDQGAPGNPTGDIYSEIWFTQRPAGLSAGWVVLRFTDSLGGYEVIKSGNFTTTIETGSTYTLYLGYDSVSNQFVFRVGSEEMTCREADGLPARYGYPNIAAKFLADRVRIDDATQSEYISATFDNIYKNGLLYDDFSSPTIDQTKWASYEYVREISEGKFLSKVRSGTGTIPGIYCRTEFANPSPIKVIQTKATPVVYQNTQGAVASSRVAGIFYNDGAPGGGFLGDVGAEVYIGGTGENPIAGWTVWTFSDSAGSNSVIMASGIFATPIILGNTYTLLLGWDGSQIVFKIGDEGASYTPVTSIYPPHIQSKEITTRIRVSAGQDAIIETLFDDVMVNGRPRIVDFDGDGKTDLTVWRPGDGYWYSISSKDGSVSATQWGSNALNDVLVPGDYDGDGKTDYAVWRPAEGFWYIINSKDGSITSQQWGAGSAPYNDKPVPGDYDGDGKTDIAIWRQSDGYWYIINSKDGSITSQQWGAPYAPYNDVAVLGDYDGDGKTDIAVWRESDGYWYIINSEDGSITSQQWGTSGDMLVPGDYDGDGKTDIAVWRPAEGFWYIISSKDGSIITQQWGAGYAPYNDVPVPGDYDGDGKTDIAIWREADGYWYILKSLDGEVISKQWGAGYAPYNDKPISQELNW